MSELRAALSAAVRVGVGVQDAGRMCPEEVLILPEMPYPLHDKEDLTDLAEVVAAAKTRGQAALQVVEACEQATRALAALQLDALTWLADATVTMVDPYPFIIIKNETTDPTRAVNYHVADTERLAYTTVVTEVTTATGLPEPVVAERVLAAVSRSEAQQRVHQALSAGTISSLFAQRLIREIDHLDPEPAAAVVDAVLVPRQRREGLPLSHQLLRRRLTKALSEHDQDNREAARARKLAGREARAFLDEDGTGTLTITGTSPRVVAAMDRIDSLARALQTTWPTSAGGEGSGPGAAGESAGTAGVHRKPTLAQLRSDVALDLLLYGTIQDAPEDVAPGGDNDTSPATGTLLVGQDPPAVVHLAISIDTLLTTMPNPDVTPATEPEGTPDARADAGPGTSPADDMEPGDSGDWWWTGPGSTTEPDTRTPPTPDPTRGSPPGFLLGHGYLPADQARALAVAPGTIWHRLLTDPETGVARELSTASYTPTPRMREQVLARDPFSRFPGSAGNAKKADLDHVISWPAGTTRVDNLQPLRRSHHQLKTKELWTCQPHPDKGSDGAVVWTSLMGRDYVTYPTTWTTPRPNPTTYEAPPPS